MMYRECEWCGASLDPQEVCDCVIERDRRYKERKRMKARMAALENVEYRQMTVNEFMEVFG